MRPTTPNRALAFLGLLVQLAAAPAAADTYQVDRTDDSTIGICNPATFGDCALRGAIIKANTHAGADVVQLGAHTYTLTIAGRSEDLCQTGDLDVRESLVIQGSGPERTTIDAAGIDRVLQLVVAGTQVTVRGVTITGGDSVSQSGGGIHVQAGALRLETCVVSGNASQGFGSGIAEEAWGLTNALRIFDSGITGNTGPYSVIATSASLFVKQSTISDNTGVNGGLAVFGDDALVVSSTVTGNEGAGVDGWASDLVVSSCTLTGNTGPALRLRVLSTPPDAYLSNNIIVGWCDEGIGSLASGGGNIESPGDTCELGTLDLAGVADPMLSDLGWFGGPTPVHRPLPGSPAIDQPLALETGFMIDQRGVTRPRDGDGDPGAVWDIGAVELAGAGEVFVETFECGFATGWSSVTW